MFSTISTIASMSNKVSGGAITYVNTVYTSGSDTLTKLDTIKALNYSTTNISGNCCGVYLDGSIIAIGYAISSSGKVAVSKNGGLTWSLCTVLSSTMVNNMCFKGSSTICYISCIGGSPSYSTQYCDFNVNNTFAYTGFSSTLNNRGGIFAPSSTTSTTGNCWVETVGAGTYYSTNGFLGTFTTCGQGSGYACLDGPDDSGSYSVMASNTQNMKFFSPTVIPTATGAIAGGSSTCYGMDTCSGLTKTLCQTTASTYIISNFNTTTGASGVFTTIAGTSGIPSTAGCGSVGNVTKKVAMNLNGNVMAFLDMNTTGSIGTCWYSVNGGTTWTNLNSQYSLTETFVSVQLSRGGSGANNYMILQSLSTVYLLAFGTQY